MAEARSLGVQVNLQAAVSVDTTDSVTAQKEFNGKSEATKYVHCLLGALTSLFLHIVWLLTTRRTTHQTFCDCGRYTRSRCTRGCHRSCRERERVGWQRQHTQRSSPGLSKARLCRRQRARLCSTSGGQTVLPCQVEKALSSVASAHAKCLCYDQARPWCCEDMAVCVSHAQRELSYSRDEDVQGARRRRARVLGQGLALPSWHRLPGHAARPPGGAGACTVLHRLRCTACMLATSSAICTLLQVVAR